MVPTCETTQGLAERIERAYLRGRPRWRQGCSNPRVWLVAAANLVRLHREDPAIPVDPELFVASQPAAAPLDDPWQVLTQPASARRYLRRVRRIVRTLREELRREVRRGEGRLRHGACVESVLEAGTDRISPWAGSCWRPASAAPSWPNPGTPPRGTSTMPAPSTPRPGATSSPTTSTRSRPPPRPPPLPRSPGAGMSPPSA